MVPCSDKFSNGTAGLREVSLSRPPSLRQAVFAERGRWQRKKRFQHRLLFIVRHCSQRKSTLVPVATTTVPKSYGLNMPIYFVKPKEPTVLSHKEYHELSSTDLLLSWTVSPPLHMIYPKATLTPGHGIGSERPRSSRDLGYRKVQRCTEQDVVKFSAHRGETSETGYTRHTLEGIPLFHSPSEPSYHGV